MYFRQKVSGNRSYLQVVEGYREDGRVRQRVITTLGRTERLLETGQLDALLASGAKFSQKVSVMGAHKRGDLQSIATKKIGPGKVMERLWKETGIQGSLNGLLSGRRFQFNVERAIFLTVVHRLMDPGSDRAAERWRGDYRLSDCDQLDLHHLYRAMAWLGGVLPKRDQEGRTPFAPRCMKDLVEEGLFAGRRDLFTGLALVFFDTTSIYFEGRGGDLLGRRGNNKDHRPDLKQMVAGLVLDEEGRPICCEMWPGNTTDMKTLIPVVDRLRNRFHVGRILIVADRGMISAETIEELENRKLEYILGAQMRQQKEVGEEVLARGGRYRVVHPKRGTAKDPSPLKVKEVYVAGRRYVVCFNEEQARKDAYDREQIVEKPKERLKDGDKAFVGNKGFRKYLKYSGSSFEVDIERIEAEARLDGKWVLRTNSILAPEDVALTYKQLWMVEALFRSVKSVLETRPIYHKQDETIRGHVFRSFLALVMMRELQDRMEERGSKDAEWSDVLRDLDNLHETEVEASDGKHFIIRSEIKGWCRKVFQASGVALPSTIRLLENQRAE
jgi:transposase